MKVTKMEVGANGSSQERTGKDLVWGDNGAARVVSKEYEEGYDRIFGSKQVVDSNSKKLTDKQKARQSLYPY